LDDTTVLNANAANVQLKINEQAINTSEDWAGALANRTAGSIHEGREFALDSFALSALGGGGGVGGNIAVYAQGGIAQLDGSAGGRDYEGEARSLLAGIDQVAGSNTRIGVGAGYQYVELEAQLDDDGLRDDTLTRDMISLIPYIHFHGDDWNLRFIGGYGDGDLEVEKGPGIAPCTGRAPIEWTFAAVSGSRDLNFAVLEFRDDLAASAFGALNYAQNKVDRSVCESSGVGSGRNSDIPELKTGSGDVLLGLRMDYGGAGYIAAQMRQSFGDVDAELTYGGAAGLFYTISGMRLIMDAQRSFGGDHNSQSAGGTLEWDAGNWGSSAASKLTDENSSWGINHRWEIKHTSDNWLGATDSGVYVERRITRGDEPVDRLGGHWEVNF